MIVGMMVSKRKKKRKKRKKNGCFHLASNPRPQNCKNKIFGYLVTITLSGTPMGGEREDSQMTTSGLVILLGDKALLNNISQNIVIYLNTFNHLPVNQQHLHFIHK